MRLAIALALLLCLAGSIVDAKTNVPSDDDIAKILIQDSISSYPGPCACPYNVARNGSSCGRRSAYSKAGGYSPLCYRDDISDNDIQSYRRQHQLESEKQE